jgi:transposase
MLMSTLFGLFPFLLKLYADNGYQGPKFQQALRRVCRQTNVEIVKRCDVGKFVVLPKRRIVERTVAWLTRCRRLAKDWEMPEPHKPHPSALGIYLPHASKAMSRR